jgi:hypothetical protein
MVSYGLASKPAATVFSSLASKLVVTVSPSLASKSVVDFLVESQNQGGGGFFGLSLKIGSFDLLICASKSSRWFLGLSVASQNRRREVNAGHASRSSSLLHVKAGLTRVS